MVKREWQIFLTAVMFYTRIPCPSWVDHSADQLNKATKYLPLIGIIVGGVSAMVYWGSVQLFPESLAVLFSMVASVLLTGAFHEDGLADMCDGFWGGWTKERKLEIMKDSRIGNYGAIGLILTLMIKFFALTNLPVYQLPFIIVLGHALSRVAPVLIIYRLNYVRLDETSKVKPVSKQVSILQVIVAVLFSLLPFLIFDYWMGLLFLLMLITQYFIGRLFVKHLGGYTGDCLGAAQQITEIFIYLGFIIIWQFTQ